MRTTHEQPATTAPTRRRVGSLLLLAAVGPLVACQDASGERGAAAAPTAPPATVAVDPQDASTGVRPDAVVTVTATGGTLADVRVTDPQGGLLAGAAGPGGTSWASTAPLAPGTRYAVHAVAVNDAGATTTHDSAWETLVPAETAFPAVAPLTGSTVGVGMPLVVTFDEPVADERRADVERRLVVTTAPAPVEGAWSWSSDTTVQYRPAEHWPAHSEVHLAIGLATLEVAPGVWGVDRAIDVSIGSAMVSHVDIAAHTLTVTEDGRELRTIPVTLGQSGSGGKYVTRSGTKVVMSVEESRRMDAETTGVSRSDPQYYDVAVKYAMRLTNSGEFLHAAPWSVASQGRANVSHGCTGMSTEDARWMYQRTKVGDVVTYTGSDRAVEPGNGLNVWNEDFQQWRAGSALA